MQVEQPGAAAGEQQQYADGMMGDEDMEVSRKKQTLSVSEIVGFSHDLMVGCVYRGQSKIYSYFSIYFLLFSQVVPQFQSIEVLQEHGIAANDIEKLQGSGYYTIESVRSEFDLQLFFLFNLIRKYRHLY